MNNEFHTKNYAFAYRSISQANVTFDGSMALQLIVWEYDLVFLFLENLKTQFQNFLNKAKKNNFSLLRRLLHRLNDFYGIIDFHDSIYLESTRQTNGY